MVIQIILEEQSYLYTCNKAWRGRPCCSGRSLGLSAVQKQAILRTSSIWSSNPFPRSVGSMAAAAFAEFITLRSHLTRLISSVCWKKSSDGCFPMTSDARITPKLYMSHFAVNLSVWCTPARYTYIYISNCGHMVRHGF
ncbi:hypothetical protein ACMD2_20421 [Ananas comosus]|uniref:Uncharacterized protein n=1 Tax=Ananas comosus TaxID=4615 RepID=A0A199VBV1_ANACO|nr:hypothetical protein ACMD2_20421 [Ananas comosus]